MSSKITGTCSLDAGRSRRTIITIVKRFRNFHAVAPDGCGVCNFTLFWVKHFFSDHFQRSALEFSRISIGDVLVEAAFDPVPDASFGG